MWLICHTSRVLDHSYILEHTGFTGVLVYGRKNVKQWALYSCQHRPLNLFGLVLPSEPHMVADIARSIAEIIALGSPLIVVDDFWLSEMLAYLLGLSVVYGDSLLIPEGSLLCLSGAKAGNSVVFNNLSPLSYSEKYVMPSGKADLWSEGCVYLDLL